MKATPLKLKDYKIRSFSFKSNSAFKEEIFDFNGADFVAERKILSNKKIESLHLVELSISIKPKNKTSFPYSVQLEMAGIFEIEEDSSLPENFDYKMLVAVNGPSILFGSAREYIFLATSHGMLGPILIPTVSFNSPPKNEPIDQPQLELSKSDE